jgi:hypothetical protein
MALFDPSGPLRESCEPQVLKPFTRAEVRTTAEAAAFAGRPVRPFGCGVSNTVLAAASETSGAVSIVALDLFMSGEVAALAAYLHGDRELPVIVAAFDRHDVPLPKRNVAADQAIAAVMQPSKMAAR